MLAFLSFGTGNVSSSMLRKKLNSRFDLRQLHVLEASANFSCLSYLAKNICCRMFGTFEAERSDVKIVYGLVDQPQFWNPVWHQVSFFTLSIYTHENLFKTERSLCSESQRELLMYHPALLRCHPVSFTVYIFYSTNCRMHIINIKS